MQEKKLNDLRKERGRFAEECVALELIRGGFELIGRNVFFRTGELDLIAIHPGLRRLRFVEVRYIGSKLGYFPMPASKARKVRLAVECYLQQMGNTGGYEIAVDLATVTDDKRIEWYRLIG